MGIIVIELITFEFDKAAELCEFQFSVNGLFRRLIFGKNNEQPHGCLAGECPTWREGEDENRNRKKCLICRERGRDYVNAIVSCRKYIFPFGVM